MNIFIISLSSIAAVTVDFTDVTVVVAVVYHSMLYYEVIANINAIPHIMLCLRGNLWAVYRKMVTQETRGQTEENKCHLLVSSPFISEM